MTTHYKYIYVEQKMVFEWNKIRQDKRVEHKPDHTIERQTEK